MPVSEKQLAANRANARKSTGPRTPRGKARSSMNALRHGFWSDRAVHPDNEPTEYAAFRREIARSLAAETALELALADRIAELSWRLKLAPEAEVAIYARTARDLGLGPDADPAVVNQARRARYADPFGAVSRREGRLHRRLHREMDFYHRARELRVEYDTAHSRVSGSPSNPPSATAPGPESASSISPENGFV